MTMSRRSLLGAAAAMPLAPTAFAVPAFATPTGPQDEEGWRTVAGHYDLPPDIIQLENAYWGVMARPVREEYQRQVERVNRLSSYYGRLSYGEDHKRIKVMVAERLKVAPDEIALTRNATEALKAMIGQYQRLQAGEAVLIADLDYDSMQAACASLAKRCGADLIRIALPEPASHQGLIDAYAAALEANPKVRLMLLTHVSHRTGLMMPVRDIVAMARTRGVDVIVDAAHSWGQADFTLPDLDADFVGLNGHKWIGAPLGVGIMHIRKGRLDAIGPDAADEGGHGGMIEARIHTGTLDFAAQLTMPAALDFQVRIGPAAKAARLRALRDRWAEAVRGMDGIEILTPADPRLSCAITSFRIRGRTSVADSMAIARTLMEDYKIFTIHRAGVAKGACVRVTPSVYSTMADADALAAALRILVPRMAGAA